MSTERYKFCLSDEARDVCTEKLNEPEDEQEIHKTIDDLKQRFTEKYPSLSLIRDEDMFLIRFLRSCKYDLALSVKTLGCYHKLRNEWREVFELIEDKAGLEKAVKKGDVVNLEGRAKDRSFILLKRPGISGEAMKCFIASVFASYEKLLEDEESQIYGFTVIAEMSHLSFGFGMQMASLGRRFLKMLQEVLPIRIQMLNVVNEGFAFDAVFTIASQFMKASLREKIKLHKSNRVGLQEFIDEDVLPPPLAGTGPHVDCEQWWRRISNE